MGMRFTNDTDEAHYAAAVDLVRHLESIGQIKGPPASNKELKTHWDFLKKDRSSNK